MTENSKNCFYVWPTLIIVLIFLPNYQPYAFQQVLKRELLTCKTSFKNNYFEAVSCKRISVDGISQKLNTGIIFMEIQSWISPKLTAIFFPPKSQSPFFYLWNATRLSTLACGSWKRTPDTQKLSITAYLVEHFWRKDAVIWKQLFLLFLLWYRSKIFHLQNFIQGFCSSKMSLNCKLYGMM